MPQEGIEARKRGGQETVAMDESIGLEEVHARFRAERPLPQVLLLLERSEGPLVRRREDLAGGDEPVLRGPPHEEAVLHEGLAALLHIEDRRRRLSLRRSRDSRGRAGNAEIRRCRGGRPLRGRADEDSLLSRSPPGRDTMFPSMRMESRMGTTSSSPNRVRRSLLKLAVAFAAVISLTAAWWVFFGAARPFSSRGPLPVPNGFEDLVEAGRRIPAEIVRTPDVERTDEEIRKILKANAKALVLARRGLSRECRIPPETVDSLGMEAMMILRQTAELFRLEGVLAEREGRTGDALRSDADLLEMGLRMARGGVSIHWMIGRAVRRQALGSIHGLEGKLSAKDCREAILRIQEAATRLEPIEEVEERELAWQTAHATVWSKVRDLFESAGGAGGWKAMMRGQAKEEAALFNLLLAEGAVRAHRLERGRNPESLEALVPDYLRTVPADPFGKGPLRYVRDGDGPKVYSVGTDGEDDGGEIGRDVKTETAFPVEEARDPEEERR
jgi:hypothetical protein